MVTLFSGDLLDKELKVLEDEVRNKSKEVAKTTYFVCPNEHLSLIVKPGQRASALIMCPQCEKLYSKNDQMAKYHKYEINAQ